MNKPKSNEDRIREYISYGSPMNQAFLIEAVVRYANEIITNEAAVREQMEGSFIHPDSWIAAAKSAREHLDNEYFVDKED